MKKEVILCDICEKMADDLNIIVKCACCRRDVHKYECMDEYLHFRLCKICIQIIKDNPDTFDLIYNEYQNNIVGCIKEIGEKK